MCAGMHRTKFVFIIKEFFRVCAVVLKMYVMYDEGIVCSNSFIFKSCFLQIVPKICKHIVGRWRRLQRLCFCSQSQAVPTAAAAAAVIV